MGERVGDWVGDMVGDWVVDLVGECVADGDRWSFKNW